jgi:hypothetical protein
MADGLLQRASNCLTRVTGNAVQGGAVHAQRRAFQRASPVGLTRANADHQTRLRPIINRH